jgi:hypothetical protein
LFLWTGSMKKPQGECFYALRQKAYSSLIHT